MWVCLRDPAHPHYPRTVQERVIYFRGCPLHPNETKSQTEARARERAEHEHQRAEDARKRLAEREAEEHLEQLKAEAVEIRKKIEAAEAAKTAAKLAQASPPRIPPPEPLLRLEDVPDDEDF
jgi:hypothetical protein